MGSIFNRSGGYRRLYSFNFATIIHLGTISFVRRFVDWKDDPLGRGSAVGNDLVWAGTPDTIASGLRRFGTAMSAVSAEPPIASRSSRSVRWRAAPRTTRAS